METKDTEKVADALKNANLSPVNASDVVDSSSKDSQSQSSPAPVISSDTEKKGMTKNEVIYIYEDEVIDNRNVVYHNQTVKKEYVDVNVTQVGVNKENIVDLKINNITNLERNGSINIEKDRIIKDNESLIVYAPLNPERAMSDQFARGVVSPFALPGGFVTGNARGRIAGALKNRREQARHSNIGVDFYIDNTLVKLDTMEFRSLPTTEKTNSSNPTSLVFMRAALADDANNQLTIFDRIVNSRSMHELYFDYYIRNSDFLNYATYKKSIMAIVIHKALLRRFEITAGRVLNESGDVDDKNLVTLLPIEMTMSSFFIEMTFEYLDHQGKVSASYSPNVEFITNSDDASQLSAKLKHEHVRNVIKMPKSKS